MTDANVVTLTYANGKFTVHYDDSNIFGPQACNSYPVPSEPYAPGCNFSSIASDILRRYPAACVVMD